jgi:hypothetical protein
MILMNYVNSWTLNIKFRSLVKAGLGWLQNKILASSCSEHDFKGPTDSMGDRNADISEHELGQLSLSLCSQRMRADKNMGWDMKFGNQRIKSK